MLLPPDGLIPRSPADLTPRWLTAALANAGIEAPAIIDLDFKPLEVEVLTSAILRIRPHYREDRSPAPASLIWKRSHNGRTQFARGYRQEVEFYRDVAPTLDVSVPRCYLAAFDETTEAHVLLLEDLAPAVSGDFIDGITATQAAGVLGELARLHAARWASPSQPRPLGDFARVTSFVEELIPLSTPYLTKHVDTHAAERSDQYRADVASLFRELSGGPQTLIHGDAHAANIMFPQSPSERPFLLDWQGAHIDAPIRDIARLLILGLTIEQRREHQRDLLRGYRADLAGRGVNYDASVAEQDFLLASTLQWGWAITFFRHEEIWDRTTRDAMPTLVRRAAAAFDDATSSSRTH